MEYELYHHGILGMHWGIRRFQNKDGTWTEAGKRRYGSGSGEHHSQGDKALDSSRNGSNSSDRKIKSIVGKEDKISRKAEIKLLEKEALWAKEDKKNEKIKQKLSQETGEKSKHRLKLEAYYREKGMTQEEAEIAAYKRARTEKILAITAGLTVAAAVAYVGYKHYDKFADKVIKSGTLLQNISTDSNKGVKDAFYAAYKKSDMIKYRGLFGDQLRDRREGDVFKTTISAKSRLKVASNEHAKRILADLVKNDSEYAKNLEEHLREYGSYSKVSDEAAELVKKGVVNDTVWEETNRWLVDHEELGSKVSSKLYQRLKEAGYDAILDTNDMKKSGYYSKRPVIIFGGAEKLSVATSKKLSDIDIDNDLEKSVDHIVRQMATEEAVKNLSETARNVSPIPVSVGVSGAIGTAVVKRNEDKMVQRYRNEHPNTKMSYTEILRMLQKKKISGGIKP